MSDQNKLNMWRFALVLILVVGAFVAVLVRMFLIQTVWKPELMKLDQLKPEKEVPAMRGNIYACDGKLMASTVPYYRIYMDTRTEYLRQKGGKRLYENIDSLAWRLSHKFGDRSAADYKNMILTAYKQDNAKSRRLALYPKAISYSDMMEVKQFPLFRMGQMRGGLITEKHVRRIKPFGSLASRTIGDIYGQAEKGGRCGLELAFDEQLRGTPGVAQYQHLGSYAAYVPIIDPEDGLDITTTIDIEMQDIAESVFMEYLERYAPQQGCVALMDVHTGEIKACVNMMRGSDGRYSEADDMTFTTRPEPGSTFKIMAMMVALENGVVKADDKVNTGEGVWNFYGRKMTDTHKNGVLTMTEVIAKSSNIGMSRVIDDYYHDKPGEFVDALYKMGVGKPMDLDYPNAAKPNVRHPNDKDVKWSKTTLPWMSIGYETGMPPIYTLAFYNAIANDGKYIKPFLVKSISRNGRVLKSFKTETINSKICSSHTLRDIRAMLRATVVDGTAKYANSRHVALAGKTGTAQVEYWNNRGPVRHQITFCGYFPAEKPLYSVIVVMRKPIEPADAGTMCGPVARKIAERIYSQTVQRTLPEQLVVGDVPKVKSGSATALVETLDELDFDYAENASPWAYAQWQNSFDLKPIGVKPGLVPNVVGMGAKDAVYLLENVGLHVRMYGNGSVVNQSIAAGSVARKGDTVTLELK